MEILLQILLFVFLGFSLTKCFAWACVIRRMCGGNMAVKRLHWVANISLVLHEMFSLAPLNLFARLFSSFGTITSLFPPHSLPISFFFFFRPYFFGLSYYHLWSIASLFCFLKTDNTQISFIGNVFVVYYSFVMPTLLRVPIMIIHLRFVCALEVCMTYNAYRDL